jgi:hypothetical protein
MESMSKRKDAIAGGVLMAVVAVLSVVKVDQGCFHNVAAVERPAPGTPRADFCSAVTLPSEWVPIVVGVVIALGSGIHLLRTRPLVRWGIWTVLALALVIVAALADSLAYTHPF